MPLTEVGGLCKITPESENIFLLKGYFVTTQVKNLLCKIDTNEMVGILISDLELISHFNSGVADGSCKSKQFGKNTWFIPTCSSILLIERPHC